MKMYYAKYFYAIFFIIAFFSCSNSKNTETVFTTSKELLEDVHDKKTFNNKYKNKDVFITGKVLYIGVPKDNPPNKNKTYVVIAEDDYSSVMIYFDFFINNFVIEEQDIIVQCRLRKIYKPYSLEKYYVEFKKGKLIQKLN